MSILAYHAPRNSVVAGKTARQNSAKAAEAALKSRSKWDDEFVKILDELSAGESGAAMDGSIQQVMDEFALKAKRGHQREAEECLLVIGPRHVELYLVNESRENGSLQQHGAVPAASAFPATAKSKEGRDQAGQRVVTFFDDGAVAQFFRSALGWMRDGERDRGHVEAFRRAHDYALEHGLTGIALDRLFQRALWLFEKVRLETDFFRSPITVKEVLLEVAGKIFGGLKERSALVAGDSEEIPGVVEVLRQAGIGHLYFAPTALDSDCSSNPEYHAKIFGGKSGRWKNGEMISWDEVITAWEKVTNLPFIDLLLLFDHGDRRLMQRSFLHKLMAARNNAPLLLADLTTPAFHAESYKGKSAPTGGKENGANAIDKMYNLFFFRCRDLEQMVGQNVQVRQQADRDVSGWIAQEVKQFYQWLNSEDRFHFGLMVGRSRQMQRVFELIARIAQNDITVLIEGESGTGKELVARAIHQSSHRSRRQFVVVNCGAIPENLLESELFGHVRGAFTGAVSNKRGLFEEANGGTIFLDEIGEMSPALQVKLLRFLQDGEIKRVGSNAVMKLDVRVLTATNRNLQQMVNEGRFRSDLYYRLNVIQIALPPLRERPEDVQILATHFLRKYAGRMRKPLTAISQEAMQSLCAYKWPGNVRELENVMERAVALSSDATLGVAELPAAIRESPRPGIGESPRRASPPTLKDVERQYILETVSACHENYDEAARILGIGRTTLWRKLKIYLGENGK
jgi:DNA-binding NtrC family response regulator